MSVVLGIVLLLFVIALVIEIYIMIMISKYERKGYARMIKGFDLKSTMTKEEIFYILDNLEYPEKVSVQYDAEENIIFQTSMRTYKVNIGKSEEGSTVIKFIDSHAKFVGAARVNSRMAHLYQLMEDKCKGADTAETLNKFHMIEKFYSYKKIVGAITAICIALLMVIVLKQEQDKSKEQTQETTEIQLEEDYVEEDKSEEIGDGDISEEIKNEDKLEEIENNEENQELSEQYIQFVKNGEAEGYPGASYGDVFETFFESPSWSYYKGIPQGNEIITLEDMDVVEFTGGLLYKNAEVEALIQFVVREEDNQFEPVYLSFNGVPQESDQLYELINYVFTSYFGEDDSSEVIKSADDIDSWEIAGYYMSDTWENATADISMYSSPEDDEVGNASFSIVSEKMGAQVHEVSGTVYRLEKNLYVVEGSEDYVVFGVNYDDEIGYWLDVYLNEEHCGAYYMTEQYVS